MSWFRNQCNLAVGFRVGTCPVYNLNKPWFLGLVDVCPINKNHIRSFLPPWTRISQQYILYIRPSHQHCWSFPACRANKTPLPSRFERNPTGKPCNLCCLFHRTSQPFPKSNLCCIFYTTILHWHPELQDHTCQCHNWCRRILWWHQNQHSIFLWKKKYSKKVSHIQCYFYIETRKH